MVTLFMRRVVVFFLLRNVHRGTTVHQKKAKSAGGRELYVSMYFVRVRNPIHNTPFLHISQLTPDLFCEGIYYEAFYRHVESNRGTSMSFETFSSLLLTVSKQASIVMTSVVFE